MGAIGQKFKGKAQQIKGELQDLTGSPVKGKWSKVKGKVNDKVADARLRSRRDSNTW